jgi:hypothetical protein
VESLQSYLCSIFKRRCPHCKKHIKACARTEQQIRSIFTILKEKAMESVCCGEASSSSPQPQQLPFQSLTLPRFARIRKSLHEKRFLSEGALQQNFQNDPTPQKEGDYVATEIIFKSKEMLFDDDYEDDDDDTNSVAESYNTHSDQYYDYNTDDISTNFLKCVLMKDTGIPLCLSKSTKNKYNQEMWS